MAGSLALAAGAQILERHFAKEKKEVKVNEYSSKKDILENWLISLNESLIQLQDTNFSVNLEQQKKTLLNLQYLVSMIYPVSRIAIDSLFFLLDKSNYILE